MSNVNAPDRADLMINIKPKMKKVANFNSAVMETSSKIQRLLYWISRPSERVVKVTSKPACVIRQALTLALFSLFMSAFLFTIFQAAFNPTVFAVQYPQRIIGFSAGFTFYVLSRIIKKTNIIGALTIACVFVFIAVNYINDDITSIDALMAAQFTIVPFVISGWLFKIKTHFLCSLASGTTLIVVLSDRFDFDWEVVRRLLFVVYLNVLISTATVILWSVYNSTVDAAYKRTMQLQDQFLANSSHEVRTPLTGILGLLELALEEPLLTDRQKTDLTLCRQSAKSMLLVVNDIIDYSKMQAGKLSLSPFEFEIRDVVREVAELAFAIVLQSEKRKDIQVKAVVSPFVPNLMRGDAHRLRQILLNLMGNGIKFTNTGMVELSVKVYEEPGLPSPEGRVKLKFVVSDTGIGIKNSEKGKLFQRFSQADSSNSRRYMGSGLGLAICHKLVSLFNGQIGVQSEYGKGSQFWFTIDLEHSENEEDRAISECALLSHESYSSHLQLTNDSFEILLSQPHLSKSDSKHDVESQPTLLITRDSLSKTSLSVPDGKRRSIPSSEAFLQAESKDPNPPNIPPSRGHGDSKPDHLQVRRSSAPRFIKAPSAPLTYSPSLPKEPEKKKKENRCTVLVVDDVSVNRRILSRFLKSLKYDSQEATDGQEAVDLFKNSPAGHFSLIFMDCQMPVKDGYAASHEIRLIEAENAGKGEIYRTPIIAVTANAFAEDQHRCLDAGMDDYISKPFHKADISGALQKWVTLKHHPSPSNSPPPASSED